MAVAAVGPQWGRTRAPARNKKRAPARPVGAVWVERVLDVARQVEAPRPMVKPRPAAKPRSVPIASPQRSPQPSARRAVRKNLRNRAVASRRQKSHTMEVVQASQRAKARVWAQAQALRAKAKTVSRGWVIALAMTGGFVTALGGGLAGAEYLHGSEIFQAKHLAFVPTAHVDMDEVRARLASAQGQSLWDLSLPDLERDLQALPWVASARVVRHFPDTLHVQLQEHIPVARANKDGESWLVDASGALFQVDAQKAHASLPEIRGIHDAQVTPPEQRERRLQIALDALERFATSSRPEVTSVQVGAANEIALELRDIPTRLHFESADLDRGLERFDALFAAAQERFVPEAGSVEDRPWSDVFFNGADRNRVIVRYANEPAQSPPVEAQEVLVE